MTGPRKPGSGPAEPGRQEPDRSGPGRAGALVAGPGYEVGFGKPPEATRFRKGVSGNPRGRPKGARNKLPGPNEARMRAIILEEAYRTITVREGPRKVTVPIVQAVLRALAVNAVKGQHRSQRLFAELLSSVESADLAVYEATFSTALDYKIVWERELARRERLGIIGAPEPLPHPDHVRVDIRTGTVRIDGPATREEKADWDQGIALMAQLEAQLGERQPSHEDETDDGMIRVDAAEIEQKQHLLETLARLLGQETRQAERATWPAAALGKPPKETDM